MLRAVLRSVRRLRRRSLVQFGRNNDLLLRKALIGVRTITFHT